MLEMLQETVALKLISFGFFDRVNLFFENSLLCQ